MDVTVSKELRSEVMNIKAYKNGLAGCSGGIKGATWFTYNKVAYEPR